MKKEPLYMKLYFDAAYTEMARAIGYAGQTIPDMRKEIDKLSEAFDKDKLVAVIEEIVDINGKENTVTLKPEARKLCHQLLGASPEYQEAYYPKTAADPKEVKTTRKKRQKS